MLLTIYVIIGFIVLTNRLTFDSDLRNIIMEIDKDIAGWVSMISVLFGAMLIWPLAIVDMIIKHR